jgi:phenylacetate-CoA ligase
MRALIARHLTFPLHERLVGRKTRRYVRELEESQWASPDSLRELQHTKLRALLRHADVNTEFYRRRFREARINVNSDDAFEALARLPLLDKDEIRASIDELVWHDSPDGIYPSNTGGSGGEPLSFFVGRRRQAYDQAARIRTHRWFDVDIGDRELFLWGSPIELTQADRLKRWRDTVLNHRLLNAFKMSPQRMDEYLDVFKRYRPACLFGYPSSLTLLVEYARSHGRMVDPRSLRAVFVTGEVCYPHHRETLRSFYGVPVADCYGSRDAGFIAHECPLGSMHLTAENVIVEIVDHTRAVPVGETGEIVVTHLDAYAMPFIRYRTGDVGRLKAGRCACGRGLGLMDVVQGRTTDFLYLPDGNIKHALSIIYPLRSLSGVRQFRVTQEKDYTVTVEVVGDDKSERITREAVAREVRPVLGGDVGLRVRMVDRITAADSGKYRYVVSRAKPANGGSHEEVEIGE